MGLYLVPACCHLRGVWHRGSLHPGRLPGPCWCPSPAEPALATSPASARRPPLCQAEKNPPSRPPCSRGGTSSVLRWQSEIGLSVVCSSPCVGMSKNSHARVKTVSQVSRGGRGRGGEDRQPPGAFVMPRDSFLVTVLKVRMAQLGGRRLLAAGAAPRPGQGRRHWVPLI